jgi:hypothetical protein
VYERMTSLRGSCLDESMSTEGWNESMNAWSSRSMLGSYWPGNVSLVEQTQDGAASPTWNGEDAVTDG